MKKGTVLSFKPFGGFIGLIKQNSRMIMLASAFCIGLIFGIFAFGKYEFSENISESLLSNYISYRADSGFLKIVLNSFFRSMLYIIAVFSFGASLMGIVTVPVTVAVRGCFYGLVSALLYSQYSLRGIAFHAVFYMPCATVFVIALLLLSLEAIRFSLLLAGQALPGTGVCDISTAFKGYSLKLLLYSLLVLLSAVVDALISINFIEKFQL